MSILLRYYNLFVLRSYAEQNKKIVIFHNIDIIWKLYALCSSSSMSWLHC